MFNPSLITHKEFSWFLYSILRPYISYYVYTACVSSCLFTLSYNYLRSNYLTASVHGVILNLYHVVNTFLQKILLFFIFSYKPLKNHVRKYCVAILFCLKTNITFVLCVATQIKKQIDLRIYMMFCGEFFTLNIYRRLQ